MDRSAILAARARGATRAENQNIDYSSVTRVPFLYELQAQGVTLDLRPNVSGLIPPEVHTGMVYRLDRATGTKTLVGTLPPRNRY